MGVLRPVEIAEVGADGPGRPHSDRVDELSELILDAKSRGRFTIRVELDDEEWFGSNDNALFRSRARAAGEHVGIDVAVRVNGRSGEIVLKSGE